MRHRTLETLAMGPRKLLVFDLETVPDIALAKKLWPEDTKDLSPEETVEHIYAVHRAASSTGSDFPRPCFHKIVAIGCLLADIELEDGYETYHFRKVGCIGDESDDEATLLQKFFDFGARENLRLVSFNGLGFDNPVLKLRALHHQIPARWFMNHLTSKWDNYHSKNALAYHADLAEMLGSYRAMPKLDEVCTLAGLPGKLDVSGAKVYEMHLRGEMQGIRDYCETDVLNTYLLYLHHQHLGGLLPTEMMADEFAKVRTFLENERGKRNHLGQFLDAWNAAS
ncbi:MAG: 3'-5' exonuclease [Pseudomonas fluorescens]|nr:MAG: 3'-5' exonuclease [Pseudomonas fluorescens]